MTRYEQGFIEKCAEYGVDGTALLKRAAKVSKEDYLDFLKLKGITPPNEELAYKEYERRRRLAKIAPLVAYGLAGGVIGGTTAGLEGAAAGAGGGALLGLGAGSLGAHLGDSIIRNHVNNNRAGKPASWWAT